MNNWNWNLDELVDKVMSDLRNIDAGGGTPSDVSVALTRDFRSIQSKKTKEEVQKTSALDNAKTCLVDNDKPLCEVFELTERVIFSEVVRKIAFQTSCKRWRVCSNAVVTPSAKDELKKRNIELVFENKSIDSNRRGEDITSRRTSQHSRITLSASNPTEGCLGLPKRKSEGNLGQVGVYLVNHLPDTERFPQNVYDYLSRNSSLTEDRFSCLKEASRQIQDALTKDESLKAVLSTHDGAIASVWCNRLSGVRAVVAFSYDQVCDDLIATNANVLIVDPSRVGVYQFRRIVDYYLRSGT